MMGLSRAEARRRFDDIVAFAELEEFVDLKLKNYSSGMGVRLGFAVATAGRRRRAARRRGARGRRRLVPAEVLRGFQRLKDAGKTILLRHPRHGTGRALLRPRDADRARARARRSAIRTRSACSTTRSTSAGSCTRRAGGATRASAAAEITTCRVEATAASRDASCHTARPSTIAFEMLFHTSGRESRLRRVAAQRGRPDRLRHDHAVAHAADRAFRGRRDRRPCASSSTPGSAPAATASRPRSRAQGSGARHARPARGHGVGDRPLAPAPAAGCVDPPHRFEIERAEVPAR